METLTKIFYKNLAENCMNSNVTIQDVFFYLLSQSKMYSQKEIDTLFDCYSMFVKDKNDNKLPNCSLTWLDKDKVDFTIKLSTALIRSGRESIREIQETLFKKSK